MVGVWTMDELVERVAWALAAEYSGAPNGRVRDLPDRRSIRWYTTTGLVDRPLGMRGRTALYGRRHLLQLVAVKKRQAQGHPLAAIQAELHDASDAVLAAAARVPEEFLTGGEPAAPDAPAPARFWATAPAAAVAAPAATATSPTAPVAAPAATAAAPAAAVVTPVADEVVPQSAPLGAVRLRGGAILVLPGLPGGADRAAIEAAAEPLLMLLADRGLLKFDDGSAP